MEPIISPWIFYLMSIVDGLIGVGIMSMIIGGMTLVFCIIYTVEEYKWPRKLGGWTIAVIVTGALIMLFVPNEETITKMLVASFVTPDNIELGVEGVQTIFEYIVNTAASLFSPTANGG